MYNYPEFSAYSKNWLSDPKYKPRFSTKMYAEGMKKYYLPIRIIILLRQHHFAKGVTNNYPRVIYRHDYKGGATLQYDPTKQQF